MGHLIGQPFKAYRYGTVDLTILMKFPQILSQPPFQPVPLDSIAGLFWYKICPGVACFKPRNIFILINGQPAGEGSLSGMKQSLNHLFAFQAVTRQSISFS